MEREWIRAEFMPVSAIRPSRDWPRFHLYLSSRPDGEQLQALLGASGGTKTIDCLEVSDWLARVPDDDVAWVLDRLFRVAGKLKLTIREPYRTHRGQYRRDYRFWLQQLALASRRHPTTHWTLSHRAGLFSGWRRSGGPLSHSR